MGILYPIGLQSFPEIIKDGFVYIDKTKIIYQLIRTGRSYFLSRPRRFGKSLLVSTLKSLFKGERDLFKDLWISSSDYDWKTYPVIFLDFSLLRNDSYENLVRTLQNQLQDVANQYGIGEIRKETPPETLSALVHGLFTIGPAVILIDEYDKPILDRLAEGKLVESYRDLFKSFFENVKGLGEFLRFRLVTGVTKFTQVSLFSGMNNLEDLSFNPTYASLLGITENELETYFSSEIDEIANKTQQKPEEIRRLIKNWYNGYRFSGDPNSHSVYNPLSLMSYLKSHRLANFWFATGTPTFAYQLIREQNYELPNFESDIMIDDSIEENHEPSSMDLITLLYQTGYLTIKSYEEGTESYLLQFPNEEVRRSFFKRLFRHFSELKGFQISLLFSAIKKNLVENKFDSFFESLNTLFASIPHTIQNPNEGYYHSLIYLTLKLLGFDVNAEVVTGAGRVDLIVKKPGSVIIFEFKFNRSAREALQQIKERNYHSPYIKSGNKLTLIGANVDSASRIVNEWKSEIL